MAIKCGYQTVSSVVLTVHTFPLSLDDLQMFVRATVEGLNHPVDKHNLVEVMSHLLAVRDRQMATDKMFEPLRATIILLERYAVTIPDQVYSQMEVKREMYFLTGNRLTTMVYLFGNEESEYCIFIMCPFNL